MRASPANLLCSVLVLVGLFLGILPCSSLSAPSSTTAGKTAPSARRPRDLEPPIRRVAIVGAGIAGLSLGHALQNAPGQSTPIEISIFDSRPEPLDFAAGAGIQLNGGASVLRKINPDLHDKVTRAALPLSNIRSRTKPWVESAKNPFATLLEINLKDTIQRAGGDTERELILDGEVQAFTIMRGVLQKILFNELPSDVSNRIHLGQALTGIQAGDDDKGVFCSFDDDSSYGPFDMVCGCDGVQSAVKEYVEKGKISIDKANRESSIYSGIRIRFAVEDTDESRDTAGSSELRQYFGDGAYGLYGTYGAGEETNIKKAAYLILRDDNYIGPFKKHDAESTVLAAKENAAWTENRQSDIKADSIRRMEAACLPDDELRPVIEQSDNFFEVGVYFHNPFTLRGWKREVRGTKGTYCVLLGDSAHAMPPFLGQGANQAVQDAYCLAMRIVEHNSNCEIANIDSECKSLKELVQEYEQKRWLPTASITTKAAFLGYLETGGKGIPSKFRDGLFFVLGKLGIAEKVFLDSATPNV